MSDIEYLTRWIDSPGSRSIAFVDATGESSYVTYHELAEDVREMAVELARVHCGSSAPVAISTSNSRGFVTGLFACMSAGLPASPLPALGPFSQAADYADLIGKMIIAGGHTTALLAAGDTVAGQVLASAGCCPFGVGVDGMLERMRPDIDTPQYRSPARQTPPAALVQFTSGSTGMPRAVRLTAENIAANVEAITDWVAIDDRSLTSTWLPAHHDMGLIGNLMVPVCAQASLDMRQPVTFLRAPTDWLATLSRVPHGLTAMPTFGLLHLIRHLDRRPDLDLDLDLSGWKTLILGAERVDADVMDEFAARLGRWGFSADAFKPAYGLAEATLAVTGPRTSGPPRVFDVRSESTGRLTRHVSCGRPLPGVSIDLVDDAGAAVADGSTGEIRVWGRSVTGAAADDGLWTGDAGFVIDGELYVVGRFGDSLKVFGRPVFAEDVEAALASVQIPQRHVVLLGYEQATPVAVVAAETRDDEWQHQVLEIGHTAFPELQMRTANVPAGSIARTTSGKPRRRTTWRRLVQAGVIREQGDAS